MSADAPADPTKTAAVERRLPLQLEHLSKLIGEQPEALATGSEEFRQAALDATKWVYDHALSTEHPASHQPGSADAREGRRRRCCGATPPPSTPASGSNDRKRKRDEPDGPAPTPARPAAPVMQETPLAELFVQEMSDEQIWAQLELRARGVCEMLEYALDGPIRVDADEDEGGGVGGESESESEEDELDEEASRRELEEMKAALLAEGWDPADLENLELAGSEDEESDEEDGDEEESSEESEEGDDADLGEGVEELRDPSDDDSDDDDPGLDLDEPSFFSGGQRTLRFKRKKGGHPELDDGFFDLAAFNAEIEAAESKHVSRGRLSQDDEDDDDDNEEVDLFAPVDGSAAFDEEDLEGGGELLYKDFFDPPTAVKAPKPKKPSKPASGAASTGKVRFNDQVRVKKIKAKGKNLPVSAMFYEEEEEDEGEDSSYVDTIGDDDDNDDDKEDEDEDMSAEEDEDSDDDELEEEDETSIEDEDYDDLATIRRTKDDLLADDDEEEDDQKGMSTHEKRMATLREEIAALEAENIGKKDWTLMGEATSKSRPQNSLLEEDLEFERVMKSVPVITEDVVHSLEERIKARILEGQFDDVVRKRPVDDKPFLPSRFFELQDSKSKQSLAEIYEDEYTAAQSGGVAGQDRDGKLQKEHKEIEKLWENICHKLDALCNAHFTPKAPKGTIESVSNVAAASLESALPTMMATSSMLAPEEIFAPSSRDLRARSELTPTEKRALRNKTKKAKKKTRDAIEKSVQKFGRPKGVGDVKRQKEAALKTLVKNGKGVTVVGKKSKEAEGKRARGKS
ncbi:Mpp10 protein [Epithele typhae]|uniref:Mpp10 protein n=1 Tax=Epithele typhae TaxID=378194 RepID=UPI0020076A15|nr:Mpp10 protein [Epithele typhae]KAH9944411.1 Mpp10 protein [Epithele typhae]